MPQLYANLSKNSTVPAVSGGILWADNVNKIFYQFGGEYEHTPQALGSIFQYDALINRWSEVDVRDDAQRPAWGAGVSVEDRAEGYYLGGWLSNRTIPGWAGMPQASSNLIRYDMIGNTFSNITGPNNTGRAEGVMVYLPAGEEGLLVYFGGILDPFHNGTVIPSPLSEIHIYDILSTKWYTQTATGNVPPPRGRFCAVQYSTAWTSSRFTDI
jgi:hypothetical protein